MPKFFKIINKIISRLDLLPTGQLLRYHRRPDYRTFTGGIVSLVTIILCLIQFTNMGVQTLNKQLITSSMDITTEAIPSSETIVTSPDGGFMFAVIMYGLNLNDPNIKYFDIDITQGYYIPPYQIINETKISLVQCTSDHFNFNDQTLSIYNQFGGNTWLCPPLGQSFNVQGKITAPIYTQFTISVSKCNSSLYSNCANSSQISALQTNGSFQLVIPFINTLINPSKSDYQVNFIEDRNVFPFTTNFAVSGNGYVQSYEVITDESILPWTNEVSEKGINIPDIFQTSNALVINDLYASVTFSKSSTSVTYNRSFNKIDQYMSYVGGLVGTVIGLFFIVLLFNEISYEISLANQLFSNESQEQAPFGIFNFCYFLVMLIKKGINFLRCYPDWKSINAFQECHEEMRKQLDVAFLMKKLILLQQAMQILFSPHQYEALHIPRKITISKAKQIRKKFTKKKNKFNQQIQSIREPNEEEFSSPNPIAKEDDCTKTINSIKRVAQQIAYVAEQQMSQSSMHSMKYQNSAQYNIEKVIKQAKQGNLISKKICQLYDLQKLYQQQKKSEIKLQVKEKMEIKKTSKKRISKKLSQKQKDIQIVDVQSVESQK